MKAKLIAEIGCNHKGDFAIAQKMIRTLSNFCKVDVAKFQKRDNKKLLGDSYNLPHPNLDNSYGETYGEHRNFLEFDKIQHLELKNECEKYNLEYSSSVWDLSSASEIIEINPSYIKIPSSQNTNLELLEFILKKYDGDIHVSLGMTKNEEIIKIYKLFENHNKLKKLVLYICTSDYPAKHEDLHLLEILRIKKEFINIGGYGFSGHHNGIAADIAALTLGVNYIERHFTLDRTWKGTDHAASLEPDGMRKLQRDLIIINSALTYKKDINKIIEVEKYQYQKLKFKS